MYLTPRFRCAGQNQFGQNQNQVEVRAAAEISTVKA